jgi:hypothetical protein
MILSLFSCQQSDISSPETKTDHTSSDISPSDSTSATTDFNADHSVFTPEYEIKEIDGRYYLNFTAGNEAETDSGSSDNNNASMVDVNFIRFDSLAEMKQKLEEANVPDGRTWIVVPPFIKTKLMLAGIKFQINNGVNGTGAVAFTNELGCDIFVSNQLAKDENGNTMMLAGSYSAIAYAEQVLETQVLDRLENSFDKAVRGRLVFGAKVIKPNELVCCPVTDGGNVIE